MKFASDGGKLRATMYRLDGDRFISADSFTVGELAPVNAKNVRERFDLAGQIRWALVCLQQLIDDSHQFLGIGRLLQI